VDLSQNTHFLAILGGVVPRPRQLQRVKSPNSKKTEAGVIESPEKMKFGDLTPRIIFECLND
jgi:hypothetical protein